MTWITFYGGVNEIGGNKILVEENHTRILLDFGLSFSRLQAFYEEYLQPRTNNALRDFLTLGVIPVLPGLYREDMLRLPQADQIAQRVGAPDSRMWKTDLESYDDYVIKHGKPWLDGIFLTHGHADHFQHICFIDERVQVFASPITRALLEVAQELSQGGFEYEWFRVNKRSVSDLGKGAFFPGEPTLKTEEVLRTINEIDRNEVKIGPFTVQAVPVDHSVLGAIAYLIRSSLGKVILYTGDLRFHGRRPDWTSQFMSSVENLRPDALIIEGTRISEEHADSEDQVRADCQKIVSEANERGVLVLVSFSWKDTSRYLTLKEVAKQTGRKLVISSKLAYLVNRLARVPDAQLQPVEEEPNVQVYLRRKDNMLYSRGDYVKTKHDLGYRVEWDKKNPASIDICHYEQGVRAYEIRENPRNYILHIDYFELSELLDLEPPLGTVYIRAMSEPFNEEMELDEQRLVNWLRRFGINSPDGHPIYLHASGHASGAEIRKLVTHVHPRLVFPIHTLKPGDFGKDLPVGTSLALPSVGQRYQL